MFVCISQQADFVSTLLFKILMLWMIFLPGNPLKQEEYVSFQVNNSFMGFEPPKYLVINLITKFLF